MYTYTYIYTHNLSVMKLIYSQHKQIKGNIFACILVITFVWSVPARWAYHLKYHFICVYVCMPTGIFIGVWECEKEGHTHSAHEFCIL